MASPATTASDAMTAEQQARLEAFTERAKDLTTDPGMLLRFLRAREWDLDAAYEQLSKSIEWRKAVGADEILAEEPAKMDLLKKLVPAAFYNEDRQGRPLYIERTGMIDIPRMNNLVNSEELTRCHIYGQEAHLHRCREASKKHGRLVTSIAIIMDMTGLNSSHDGGMDNLQKFAEMDKQNYPELLGRLYVINAPWYFPVLYKVARLFMDEATRNKVQVLSKDYKEVLVREIGPENLPVEYGGQCRDPMPQKIEVDIDVEAYDPPLTDAPVPAGKVLQRVIQCGPKGASVSWFFRLAKAKNEIKFHVLWHPQGGQVTHALKPQVYKAGKTRVEGAFESSGPGNIVLLWDNSAALLTNKTVRYHLVVHQHHEDEAAAAAE